MRNLTEQLLLTDANRTAHLVTDGLILWVDGRDAPDAQKSLKDRVSETYSSLIGGANPNQFTVTAENGFLNLSNTVYGSSSAVYQGADISAAQTIECVMGPGSTSEVWLVTIPNAGDWARLRIYVSGHFVRYGWGNGQFATLQISSAPLHIAARPGAVFVNGVWYETPNLTSVSGNYLWTASKVRNSTYRAQIGAIRVYDRMLTDAEILQNYEYEKQLGRIAE